MTIRLRLPKSLLHHAQNFCFGVGLASLGVCATVVTQSYFFQTYENWAFDQKLRNAPVSYANFVTETLSSVGSATLPSLPGRDMNFGAPAFQLSADRSVIGRIEIPRIGLKTVILEGVAQRTLSLAVGHIPGTALPGMPGNVGIAGHRDTFFRSLREVEPGDSIILTTFEGAWEYRVQSCEIVRESGTSVLDDGGAPELTLVTCYPFYYVGPAPERFIVHARRVAI